jgi:hypothetical protein
LDNINYNKLRARECNVTKGKEILTANKGNLPRYISFKKCLPLKEKQSVVKQNQVSRGKLSHPLGVLACTNNHRPKWARSFVICIL